MSSRGGCNNKKDIMNSRQIWATKEKKTNGPNKPQSSKLTFCPHSSKQNHLWKKQTWLSTSVTRNGDLLPFWAILEAKNFYSKNKNVKFKKMRPKVIEPSAIFEPKTFWPHCPSFQGKSK